MEWAIIENELGFYLKEIRIPSDVGDSKFMIYNELSRDYNANVSYSMDIRPLTDQQYLEFNGWKLIEIKFPGDWFGQTGVITLEDTFGERQDFPVTRHARYKDNRANMLKMALDGAKRTAEENFSVEYWKFLNKNSRAWSSYHYQYGKCDIDKLKQLTLCTQEYIEEYMSLKSKIVGSEDKRIPYFLNKAEEVFVDTLKEYYSFDIDGEE